jgi:hypothetical protein
MMFLGWQCGRFCHMCWRSSSVQPPSTCNLFYGFTYDVSWLAVWHILPYVPPVIMSDDICIPFYLLVILWGFTYDVPWLAVWQVLPYVLPVIMSDDICIPFYLLVFFMDLPMMFLGWQCGRFCHMCCRSSSVQPTLQPSTLLNTGQKSTRNKTFRKVVLHRPT